eukprot:1133623-Rhodomonas_salina.4
MHRYTQIETRAYLEDERVVLAAGLPREEHHQVVAHPDRTTRCVSTALSVTHTQRRQKGWDRMDSKPRPGERAAAEVR